MSLGVSDSSQPEGCSIFKHYRVRNECTESGAAYPEVKTKFRNQLSEFTIMANIICISQIFRETKIGIGRGYLHPWWVKARSDSLQVPAVLIHFRKS